MEKILNQPQGPQIIIALDYKDESTAIKLVEQLDNTLCRLKVGKELFVRCGPSLVEKLVAREFDVFLDLKFHDIPNTVAAACSAAADMGVWMVNVHASGGRKMMLAARDAIAKGSYQPLLIAVTVLTSMGRKDLVEIGLDLEPWRQVERLAQLAKSSGFDGVVCSPKEASMLKQLLGKEFYLVTPGVRPKGANAEDQQRIMTPKDAISAGSDYLVIGRPITAAKDPLASLQAIQQEISSS